MVVQGRGAQQTDANAAGPDTDLCCCMDNEEDEPCNNVFEDEAGTGSDSGDDEQDIDDYDDDEDDE